MRKITQLPSLEAHARATDEVKVATEQVNLPAMANSLTAVLIQQALDDACMSKDWKAAKKKIDVAIKRGHMRIVKS